MGVKGMGVKGGTGTGCGCCASSAPSCDGSGNMTPSDPSYACACYPACTKAIPQTLHLTYGGASGTLTWGGFSTWTGTLSVSSSNVCDNADGCNATGSVPTYWSLQCQNDGSWVLGMTWGSNLCASFNHCCLDTSGSPGGVCGGSPDFAVTASGIDCTTGAVDITGTWPSTYTTNCCFDTAFTTVPGGGGGYVITS